MIGRGLVEPTAGQRAGRIAAQHAVRGEEHVLGQIEREVAIRHEATQVACEFGLVLGDEPLEACVGLDAFVDAEDENVFQGASFSR